MKEKIQHRIMAYTLVGVAVIMIILTGMTALFFFQRDRESIYRRNLLLAAKYSNEINSFMQKYTAIARTFAHSQAKYSSQQRSEVLAMLKEVIEDDKNIVGFCVAYEPGKFDGRDAEFANSMAHDGSGRFIPYWNRLKGDLVVEPLVDMDKSDWYLMPKKTKKLFLTDPIIYDGVLMISIDAPILKEGQFVGMVGLDLSLQTIKKLLEDFDKAKAYPSNYAFLVNSQKGLLVSSSRPIFSGKKSVLNQSLYELAQTKKDANLRKLILHIKDRKEGFLSMKGLITGEESILFYVPIQNTPLSFVVSVSRSDLLQNTLKVTLYLTLLGIFSIGVIAIILYFTINGVVRPLNHLTNIVAKFSEQNFSFRAKIFHKDEVGKLAATFNSMADDIMEYREKMEEKVRERTEELNRSLLTTTKLKNQQDGDYFLTTLITEPLMQNRSKCPNIKIDFLIEQKKKFSFRKRSYNLGGDICVTGDLNFSGEIFSMFFNGDAMGKSMQGAGGALVIGSALNSIMARSAAGGKVLTKQPMDWLQDAYRELQRVMESFGGSMFISCILGIINCSSGEMYYFNAEHPFPILYRDRKASFLSEDISIFKIGSPFNQDIQMFSYRMQEGDIFLCGSDGKDDLILEVEEDGTRTINQDETLFLEIVEKNQADIYKIQQSLTDYGEISDDLSLLKIKFQTKSI